MSSVQHTQPNEYTFSPPDFDLGGFTLDELNLEGIRQGQLEQGQYQQGQLLQGQYYQDPYSQGQLHQDQVQQAEAEDIDCDFVDRDPYTTDAYTPAYPPGAQSTHNGGYQDRTRHVVDKVKENGKMYYNFIAANREEAMKVGGSFGTVAGAGISLYGAATAAALSPPTVVAGAVALAAGGFSAGVNSKQAYDKWNEKTAEERKKKINGSKRKKK
jgi:hypothetical protein